MIFIQHYDSPLGGILLAADEIGLVGLCFDGEKYFGDTLYEQTEEKELPVFDLTKQWLDIYFSGNEPDFMPPIKEYGSEFRLTVWEELKKIPYGNTVTYGDIGKNRGIEKMSSQAVGGAVGHNSISIIIPCHRVIGAKGNLTGYAGGIDKKIKLLELEGIDVNKFFISKSKNSF